MPAPVIIFGGLGRPAHEVVRARPPFAVQCLGMNIQILFSVAQVAGPVKVRPERWIGMYDLNAAAFPVSHEAAVEDGDVAVRTRIDMQAVV